MFQNLINDLGNEYDSFKKSFKTGKLVDAFEELQKIEGNKSDLLKAFVLVLLKKTKRALDYLKEIDLNEQKLIGEDIYYELLGFCYNEEKNKLEATKYYLKALEVNSKNFYARYNLTNIYLEKKDYKNAYNNLLILAELEPENNTIKSNLESVKKHIWGH